jgi:hypothetical protein
MKKNRSYLRSTIGVAADEAARVHTKKATDAVLAQGSGESLSKLGGLFGGAHAAMDVGVGEALGVSDPEEPVRVEKKKGAVPASKKHAKAVMAGGDAAKRARLTVSKKNKRGQTKNGFSTNKAKPRVARKRGMAKF